MTTFRYFAYGSNMLTARLRARCASARPVRLAYAEGHRLEFSKLGRDGSGKGHLARVGGRWRAAGVLFEIDLAERALLDAAEGLGAGYARRDDFPVRRADTREVVEASVYLATAPDPARLPYDWYLGLIVAGALEHGMDRRRLRRLVAAAFLPHVAPPWGDREHALALLAAAGAEGDLSAFFATLAGRRSR